MRQHLGELQVVAQAPLQFGRVPLDEIATP
jgi:hypothetical protein